MRPSVSLDADRVTLHLVSLTGVPFSSALSEDDAAKLAVDIAHLLAVPWQNRRAEMQFCPRHPNQLVPAGGLCDACEDKNIPGEPTRRNRIAKSHGALFCESCGRHHFHQEGDAGCLRPLNTSRLMRLAGHETRDEDDVREWIRIVDCSAEWLAKYPSADFAKVDEVVLVTRNGRPYLVEGIPGAPDASPDGLRWTP